MDPGAQEWWSFELEDEQSEVSMHHLLEELRVPQCMRADFLLYTPREFGMVATGLQDLDSFISSLAFPAETELPHPLLVARVRLLWKRCCELSQVPPSPAVVTAPQPPSSESGWVEAFPKKLGSDKVKEMVARFKSRYPSEPLSPECMPSARLLALVAKQLQDNHWRYVPWKFRLSEEQQERQAMTRPAKAPRLETLLFDDVPTREIPGPHMGKCLMQELLGLQAVAIALCGGAHLYTLREMNRRFINRCLEKFSPESGLRGPTVSEAQDADQRLWQSIAALCNDEQWSLDDAIHEVVVVRSELQNLLTPRPTIPKVLMRADGFRLKGKGKGFHQGGYSKGGGHFERSGEKGEKGHGKAAPLVVAGLKIGTFYMAGRAKRMLCKDFQQGRCTRGKVCGVFTGNGKLCLGEHEPSQHKKTPH